MLWHHAIFAGRHPRVRIISLNEAAAWPFH
jgi:hypothetical protein